MLKGTFKRLLLSLAIVFLLPQVGLAQIEKYIEGEHYERLPQAVRTRDESKIEVVEMFWYGCSHCYDFEPLIKTWKGQQPDDVDFRPTPAAWAPAMEVHAKAFYAAQNLGVLDKLHGALFAALNVEKKQLAIEKELAELFARYGVEKEAFSKEFNSFGVQRQVKQAMSRMRSYRTQGTPEVIVAGKYRVSSRKAGGQAGMLAVASFLVD